ncbi:Calcium Channel Inhibitor [Tolypocladium capitatum]|uniref:Calcium Channel Inhibitor n=1 Tax=Tolypocladium capitatum TaxID=45235 RepID=A0A2K3QCU2_9HYPO|nr:Calcium Channel Inhibitor [Tolypocladium capitatum]
MISLAVLATYVAAAAGYGIHCMGNVHCNSNDAKLVKALDQVEQLQAQGHGSHVYQPRVHIACVMGLYMSACVYYDNGASDTVDRAAELLQVLVKRGCTKCGCIPTKLGNNAASGSLRFDLTPQPCCSGTCICPI